MIDELVEFYGEQWRPLIAGALTFLDAHEPAWGVTLNRWEYIAELLAKAKGPPPLTPSTHVPARLPL